MFKVCFKLYYDLQIDKFWEPVSFGSVFVKTMTTLVKFESGKTDMNPSPALTTSTRGCPSLGCNNNNKWRNFVTEETNNLFLSETMFNKLWNSHLKYTRFNQLEIHSFKKTFSTYFCDCLNCSIDCFYFHLETWLLWVFKSLRSEYGSNTIKLNCFIRVLKTSLAKHRFAACCDI